MEKPKTDLYTKYIQNSEVPEQFQNYTVNIIHTRLGYYKEKMEIMLERTCRKNTYILNVVVSHALNVNSREDIRTLHGNNSHSYRYNFSPMKNPANVSHCTVFAIGLTNNQGLNRLVEQEMIEKNDIILVPVIDEYRKIANKIMTYLKMLENSYLQFKYILKCDDDVYVDFERILPFIYESPAIEYGGHLLSNLPTRRDPKDKWYLSEEEYPSDVIPKVVLGVANIMNRKIINKILKLHQSIKIHSMEDIYMTELVLKADYNIIHISHLEYCLYNQLLCPK
ncbi:hypothetical protein HZS_7709, partial [Henneguya salminicola]